MCSLPAQAKSAESEAEILKKLKKRLKRLLQEKS
jgi:hypothetical protein